jgi:hypothetical protein
MNPSGESQCVGCKLIFTEIDGWRVGPAAKDGDQAQSQDLGANKTLDLTPERSKMKRNLNTTGLIF